MPRLSLYRPDKSHDYSFIDKNIAEFFQVGGVDVYCHKYLGIINKDNAKSKNESDFDPFSIQDILFLENRDRKYSEDVYILRGIYNINDVDFNLSQFGLFLQNDTLFMTFHINETIQTLGRRIISGDVVELPHLKDDHSFGQINYALKRFYVVEDVNRAAEGFSAIWYPHLYRAKCIPLVDSQEFSDILDSIPDKSRYQGIWNPNITYFVGDIVTGPDGQHYTVLKEATGIEPPNSSYYELANSLRDVISTYDREIEISSKIIDFANNDVPLSGFDNTMFFSLNRDENGLIDISQTSIEQLMASMETQATDNDGNLIFNEDNMPVYVGQLASSLVQTPNGEYYKGYLTGDGIPPNGVPFTSGISYPELPAKGQYHLRTDYVPNRLFRYTGKRWSKIEDNVRMTLNNAGQDSVHEGGFFENQDVRLTQKTSFINNTNTDIIDGREIEERQALSKVLRPKSDK